MSRGGRGRILFKLVLLLCFVAFCGLIYLIRHPLLRFAGGFWVVEDPLERADALIILSDDNFYADRATRAVELYRQGLAPIVVASGRRLRPYAGIAELMDHDLFERGVPKQAIIKLPHTGDNTREEAVALRTLVEEHRWRRVIIVTSNSHTRRARYIFRRVFPAAVVVRVASARDSDYDPDHWWETRKGQKRFFHEAVGMVVAWWELHGEHVQTASAQAVVGVLGELPQLIVSQARKHATFATPYSALHCLSAVLCCALESLPLRCPSSPAQSTVELAAGGVPVWRKVDEPKAHPIPEISTAAKVFTDVSSPAQAVPAPPLSSRAVACISQGIRVKGEITGREDLFIDGEIEGRIQVTEGTVTVGPNGRVLGQIEAREVAVRGLVEGNIAGSDRVHVWHTGHTKGDIRAKRIAIDDGAVVRGKLETLGNKQETPAIKETPKPATNKVAEPVPVSSLAG